MAIKKPVSYQKIPWEKGTSREGNSYYVAAKPVPKEYPRLRRLLVLLEAYESINKGVGYIWYASHT